MNGQDNTCLECVIGHLAGESREADPAIAALEGVFRAGAISGAALAFAERYRRGEAQRECSICGRRAVLCAVLGEDEDEDEDEDDS